MAPFPAGQCDLVFVCIIFQRRRCGSRPIANSLGIPFTHQVSQSVIINDIFTQRLKAKQGAGLVGQMGEASLFQGIGEITQPCQGLGLFDAGGSLGHSGLALNNLSDINTQAYHPPIIQRALLNTRVGAVCILLNKGALRRFMRFQSHSYKIFPLFSFDLEHACFQTIPQQIFITGARDKFIGNQWMHGSILRIAHHQSIFRVENHKPCRNRFHSCFQDHFRARLSHKRIFQLFFPLHQFSDIDTETDNSAIGCAALLNTQPPTIVQILQNRLTGILVHRQSFLNKSLYRGGICGNIRILAVLRAIPNDFLKCIANF